MTHKDTHEIAVEKIAALQLQLTSERRLLQNARTRLFSRVTHPSSLSESESYEVDLSQPWFASTYDGKAISFGPCQLIGTHLPSDGSWLWGWCNPSVSPEGYSELRSTLEGIPELKDITSCERFECSERFADDLATYIAVKAGFLGAYPAQVAGTTAYLALRLAAVNGQGYEWKDNHWCCFCGRVPSQVEVMIASQEGMYACSNCIDTYHEIAFEMNDTGSPATDTYPEMPSCIMCGECSPGRVFSDYSSFCRDCIELAASIVKQRRSSQQG